MRTATTASRSSPSRPSQAARRSSSGIANGPAAPSTAARAVRAGRRRRQAFRPAHRHHQRHLRLRRRGHLDQRRHGRGRLWPRRRQRDRLCLSRHRCRHAHGVPDGRRQRHLHGGWRHAERDGPDPGRRCTRLQRHRRRHRRRRLQRQPRRPGGLRGLRPGDQQRRQLDHPGWHGRSVGRWHGTRRAVFDGGLHGRRHRQRNRRYRDPRPGGIPAGIRRGSGGDQRAQRDPRRRVPTGDGEGGADRSPSTRRAIAPM